MAVSTTDPNLKATFGHLPEEDAKEIEEVYRSGGAAGFAKLLQDRNDRWKTVPLNIAVIGQSGAGKSSYINCSRNITAEDEGGAAVGITETTSAIKSYAHPDNHLLLYWELPGVGTPNFPRGTYLEKINFTRYDFYLLLSSTRFSDNDLWLGEEIKKHGKKFFFVRTKSGIDVKNQRKSHPKGSKDRSDDDILQQVRNDIIAKLNLEPAQRDYVFLIDSYKKEKFEFWKLQDRLLSALPELKREAFLYSLSPMGMLSKKILQEKVESLKNRIWMIALTSGITGLIPIPGASAAIDLTLVFTECSFYKHQLGLDPASLAATAASHGVDVHLLEKAVASCLPSLVTKDLIFSLCKELAYQTSGQIVEEALKFIPIIGSLIAAPISYLLTRQALYTILDKMDNAANQVIDICVSTVHRKALEETRKDCEELRNKKPASGEK
ncbi:interferon-inducible GTPase 5-like [Paramacrobiotus metropolitanus]|uniref:interferon-inducible GTPase 5-like n=1 Tax=Paramacrobiotus metropolitanus TaxID=2943436 RepID=UPI002445CAF7|nr:interferon-inducible GTPase 5-like [Paramacrobiotus metropolitanus]